MRSTARLAFLALAVACLVAALPVSALPPEEPAAEIADAPRAAMGTHNVVGADPDACIKPGPVNLSRSPSSVAVGGTVTLTWNAQSIQFEYIPVYSLSASGPWEYLLDPPYTTTATHMTVTISGASLAGKTIYFFVRALGSCEGVYTDSNVVSVSVTGGSSGCVGPPTPSLSIDRNSVAAGGSFKLTWTADPYGTTDYWWLGVGSAETGSFTKVATYSRTTLSATLSTVTTDAGKTLYFRVWAYPYGGSNCAPLKTYSNAVSLTVTSGGSTSCTADANTLCLYNNRFRVRATYKDYQNNTGTAKAVSLTSDAGYFWFFSQTNVELVAKIVSFCSGSSGNYGLYVSGLTDVNVTFTVTDTKNGYTRNYTNPLGNRYCTVGDPWAVCP
ncbi:hypothetical protein FBQ97_05685 [Acidobacteria bacterium ACD]|nr:MAG: hypothetical protein EDX89_19365 [Acidobacteriota bacterium]MCE7957715.1 hypothetical protein [Acidobacteria bacterium ACB2]MDL1949292.1 hypothetical protein [Acidobacteria bacterium ACD]